MTLSTRCSTKLLLEEGPNEILATTGFAKGPTLEKKFADADQYPIVISHNDSFYLNFLIDEAGTYSCLLFKNMQACQMRLMTLVPSQFAV